MKKYLLLLCGVLLGNLLQAQSNELELFQTVFNVEKKAALMEYLQLSDEEGKAFWPIYDAYEIERKQIMEEKFTAIKKYAEVYQNLTDEQAYDLMTTILKLRQKNEKVTSKYFKKINKQLGGVRASQFVQFENYVLTELTLQLSSAIPFIQKN